MSKTRIAFIGAGNMAACDGQRETVTSVVRPLRLKPMGVKLGHDGVCGDFVVLDD